MASGEDGRRGPSRVPKNMKGLLEYCVVAAAGTESSEAEHAQSRESSPSLGPMSEERRRWLEKALNELTVNPVQRMKQCISIVMKENESNEALEEKLIALVELTEWCEHIDFAIDFHKIGGFDTFDRLLNDPEAEIRWKTLELIATFVQNNPYCQKAVLDFNYIPVLLKILDTDQNSTVQIKALYALSCLTRDAADCQAVFFKHDGFSVLMRAMQTDVEKLKIKAAFMLSSICCDKPEFKDTLCNMGMIEQLVGHLSEEHSNFHEHAMSALLCLVRDHEPSVRECQRDELNLPALLREKIKFLQDKEEFEEEADYTTELLKLIYSNSEEDIVR